MGMEYGSSGEGEVGVLERQHDASGVEGGGDSVLGLG